MIIENSYLQSITYSKNPAMIAMETPENFPDLHNNIVEFALDEKLKEGAKEGKILISINMSPKDMDKGVVDYSARYLIQVSGINEESANEIIQYAAEKTWNKVHADYVKAMNDLDLPTSGFPLKPIIPEFPNNQETPTNEITHTSS